jgi:hypothetical protein
MRASVSEPAERVKTKTTESVFAPPVMRTSLIFFSGESVLEVLLV